MTLYWLLSVPAHGDGHVAWRDVKSRVGDAEVYDFTLPQFKIGTLDTLVRLSDELAKYDTAYESTTGKFIDTLRNLTNTNNSSLASHLLVEDKSVDMYTSTRASDRAKMAGKSLARKQQTDEGAFDMHEFSNVLSDYTPFVFFELPWTFLDSD
ncbi:Vacuolar ATP synthase subunit C [Coemansia aciculifera]|nr:Vacuolar ATP synthase subunit C [Coemansia aciculifera]